MKQNPIYQSSKLSSEQLYWHVDPNSLPFKTTKDLHPDIKIFGQASAKEALEYVINCAGPGQNAYVRGIPSSGRKVLVQHILNEQKPKVRRNNDYCYVHNFSQINSPRLVILEAGSGKLLKQMLTSFADYVINELPKTFNSESIRQNRKQTEDTTNAAVAKLYEPLEKELQENQLTLANVNDGKQTHTIIAPLIDGKIVTAEDFLQLKNSGKITPEFLEKTEKLMPEFQEKLHNIATQASEIIEHSFGELRKLDEDFTKQQLNPHLNAISKKFSNKFLDEYLNEIIVDFIDNKLHNPNATFNPNTLYGVNIINKTRKNKLAPIVFESAPTIANLVGTIEPDVNIPAYASILAGSILKADGGFLIVEVDEALAESGAWLAIMRTLRTGYLHITNEDFNQGRTGIIKPDAIPVDVQVILIGSHQRFYELSKFVNDFPDQFKVLIDLETELNRDNESFMQYSQVIYNTIIEEKLLHFSNEAIAQLIEHGARLCASKDKISAQFGLIIDTAREANYIAKKSKAKLVENTHVIEAIIASKKRSSLPAKSFYQLLEKGIIIVDTDGQAVGQINGLAVAGHSNISYGFPARITATVSPGQAGLINIEGQANLSGQIHTKGFQILGGLLRYLIKPKHPLAFSASIAFEQSYGGIDGDSASGAEACCLLSAITNIPIQQNLAMTGAIDQFGHLQAIGGVNEKIEGFYDCCKLKGLTGEQGVIIPKANVAELMLRNDIINAHNKGKFHIYAVDHVLDAVALLTDTPSSKDDFLAQNSYKAKSFMAKVCERAEYYHKQSTS